MKVWTAWVIVFSCALFANASMGDAGSGTFESAPTLSLPPDESPVAWIQHIENSQGGKFILKSGTYYIDRQYQLPPGTEIIGAGSEIGGTLIKAVGADYYSVCDADAKNRKGFLLGDDSYIGHLRFQGMEKLRFCNNNLLCGGAPFETPGCAGTGRWEEAPKYCSLTGQGRGVHNATVEDIFIEPLTVQNAVYIAPTPKDVPVSQDVVIRNVVTHGTWADGLNIHGAHKNILVENCDLRNLGDDAYAIWSIGDGADNITFQNNIAANPRYRPGCTAGGGQYGSTFCFAVYGGRTSKHLNNHCYSAKSVVGYGGPWGNYGGKWAHDGSSIVTGVAGNIQGACSFGSPPPFRVSCSIEVLRNRGDHPSVFEQLEAPSRPFESAAHDGILIFLAALTTLIVNSLVCAYRQRRPDVLYSTPQPYHRPKLRRIFSEPLLSVV